MENCLAPQWADFTRSLCQPSDSYFEVEHEVHRPRKQAERLAAVFKTKFAETPVKFEVQERTKPESSQVNHPDGVRSTKKCPSEEMIGPFRGRANTVGRRRSVQVRAQAKVLTCQYARRCPTKSRRRSNQFVSLAEAVSKFQSATPQRFRTLSQKDTKPTLPAKTKQKLTYPVSPALRCKYRTRTAANLLPANAAKESFWMKREQRAKDLQEPTKAKTEERMIQLQRWKPHAQSVVLNTDKRAKERCEFNERIRMKKLQEELEKQEEERDRLEREREAQAELRKLAEIRARPMPIFKPPIIQKSSKPLTNPKSPAWASRPKPMRQNPQ